MQKKITATNVAMKSKRRTSVLAPLYAVTTDVGKKFGEIREKEDLGAVLKWRASQF
jgi:hypothetical protein